MRAAVMPVCMADGRIATGPLITGHVGLDGVAGAFEALASPERHAKIIVRPQEDSRCR